MNEVLDLKNKIREKQIELDKMVMTRNYNLLDEEVIELSQKLDKMIIKYIM